MVPYVNPNMEVLDTPTLIKIAKEAGAKVVVDNTWLTPFLLQPSRIGADLVIHSVTKYVGGHGNAMGGVVSGPKALVDKIVTAQNWLRGLDASYGCVPHYARCENPTYADAAT